MELTPAWWLTSILTCYHLQHINLISAEQLSNTQGQLLPTFRDRKHQREVMQCTGISNQLITQNQLGWKRPLDDCSPPKKHTSSATVEKAEKGRPGNGLNVCKSALHSVRKDSSHKHRFRNLSPPWNNSQEGKCWIPNPPCAEANTKGVAYI